MRKVSFGGMLAIVRDGCGFGSKEFAETERRLAADLLWTVEKQAKTDDKDSLRRYCLRSFV